ncbi:MAG: autotransporter domain-containing protein [Verrucomicrobia bacterium]|nr:autotransporter domain-containing protein [Verrucomicrobiota bacterium]
MNFRHRLLPLLAISTGVATASTNLYWNTSGIGGDGIWGTGPGDKNWNITAGAASENTTWPDTGSEVAVFQDALGGTVTVFDAVTSAGITQNGSGYTINAGDIRLDNPGPALPVIEVNSDTLTIQSTLSGTTGFRKTGAGILALESTNTNTGPLQLSAGTLLLNGSLATPQILITAGATLSNTSGGLSPSAILGNSGTLTMGAADTITRLTLSGGTVDGPGTLTANSVYFSGGTVAGKINGNTTSNGDVLVSGTLGGGSLDVTGGTLTLTDITNQRPIQISSGARLLVQGNGLAFAPGLTNNGTLTYNGQNMIFTYAQDSNATLDGTGILETRSGATLGGGTVAGNLRGDTTSTGNVLVSGTLGDGSLDVSGGTLTLSGSASNTNIGIALGGALVDTAGGLDAAAVLTNRGTLTIQAPDTIDRYISSGGTLAGSAILTTNYSQLGNGSSVHGNLTTTDLSASGTVMLTGPVTATSTIIGSGTLRLAGSPFQSQTVDVLSGATLSREKSSAPSIQTLTNSGTVSPGEGISVTTYISNGGTLAVGKSGITAQSARLNDGTSVKGWLMGTDTFTNGTVIVTGEISSRYTTVQSGSLILDGELSSTRVDVNQGAALTNNSGTLASSASLLNSGILVMNAPDGIRDYRSVGGTLSGTSMLTADSANLISARIESPLTAPSIGVSGSITRISSDVTADHIYITGGTLINTGSLTVRNELAIVRQSTFVASGTETIRNLLTIGPDTVNWQGNLHVSGVITIGSYPPPQSAPTGTLAITGDFTSGSGGTLNLDLGGGVNDLITVGGRATFDGALVLNRIGPVTPFVPVRIFATDSYAGNFTTLTEDLDGAAWFNPSNGTVTTLATPPSGDTLWGGTANQSEAWIALYDDVIQPGITNVSADGSGNISITSGPADASNPDLLNALVWSTDGGGLNAPVLDRLLPGVYAGFEDYATEATRAHQRTALDAPSLGFVRPAVCPANGGCKHALPAPTNNPVWEYFAAFGYFDAGTDASPEQSDYGISGCGLVAGARTMLGDRFRVGGYFAADEGEVDGALINADAEGWSLGVFARMLVEPRSHTLITAGMSYGNYQFEGTRGSLIATGGGWTPAASGFQGVDADALDIYLGASAIAWHDDRFRVIPSVMLRYTCGGMGGFAESAGGPGSPVALEVGKDSFHRIAAEISLRGEADLTHTLTAHGILGFSAAIHDEPTVLSTRFATGGRVFRTNAPGLDGDAFFLGLGATWQVRENIGLGFHWRADFRSDAETENQLGLSTAFRF